jgi:hypothetical protein
VAGSATYGTDADGGASYLDFEVMSAAEAECGMNKPIDRTMAARRRYFIVFPNSQIISEAGPPHLCPVDSLLLYILFPFTIPTVRPDVFDVRSILRTQQIIFIAIARTQSSVTSLLVTDDSGQGELAL